MNKQTIVMYPLTGIKGDTAFESAVASSKLELQTLWNQGYSITQMSVGGNAGGIVALLLLERPERKAEGQS